MDEKAPKAPTPVPEAGRLVEGSRFGAYIVGPCIGRGGMARVYRAEHQGLRRQVALKVLSEGVAQDAESRERFLREARIAAAIKHPNVVNIFDVGVHAGIPYLVMELLEGGDLASLLEAKGALDEATLISIIVPIVAGLAAVHDAGVVHRDLKPGNIYLARGRNDEVEPKLLDFGISKALGPDNLKLTFAKTHLLGTPFYISPEAVHGSEVTALSDQYSLGVLMYECATGVNPFERPFETQTVAEILRRITDGQYMAPLERNPSLSQPLASIIQRALRLNPVDRFPNLRQMGRELLLLADQRMRITWALSFGVEIEAAAAGTRPTAAVPLSLAPTASVTDMPPAPRRRGRSLGAALLVVALGIVVGLVVSDRMGAHEGSASAQTHPPGDTRPLEPGVAQAAQPAATGVGVASGSEPAAKTGETGGASVSVVAAEDSASSEPKGAAASEASKASSSSGATTTPRRYGTSSYATRMSQRAAAAAAATRSDNLPVGTNGAPILD